MKRVMTASLLVLLALGAAWAQCGGMAGVQAQSPCAAMAAQQPTSPVCGVDAAAVSSQATFDGYTYVFTGTAVEKRSNTGEVVKSVSVDCRPVRAYSPVQEFQMLGVEGGYDLALDTAQCPCPGCDCTETGKCTCGSSAGPCGCPECGYQQSAGAAARGSLGNSAQLSVNASGVTLRCCGRVHRWDLDLQAQSGPSLGEGCCKF